MLSHCLKYRENTKKKKKSKISGTTNDKKVALSSCAICSSKKSKFMKKQEANGLLSSLEIKNQNENSFSWSSFVLIILITIL